MSSNRRRPQPRAQPAAVSGIRLQKVIAAAGIASRRAAEELIVEGRVTVNGAVARVLGTRVDPERVRIEVDGERVNVHPRLVYVMLNKPGGVVSTSRDPQGRPTVVSLVREGVRLNPVGRLDVDTLGLILLTNHGELAHRLTHPRYQIPKTYLAEVEGSPTPAALKRLEGGVRLEDGPARARRARLRRKGARRSHVELVLTEGRKREVRRMFDAIGHPVVSLVRVEFGPVRLGELASGKSRRLTPAEVGALLEAVGL